MRRIIHTICTLLTCLLLAACDRTPELDSADAPVKARLFLDALTAGQWEQAYARMSPSLKRLCRSPADLGQAYQKLETRPVAFTVRPEVREMRRGVVAVGASTRMGDGRAGSVGMLWEPLDGNWVIGSIDFSGDDLC